MGTTVYWINVSMDLRIEFDLDEGGAGSWIKIDETLHRDFNARASDLVLGIQGRKMHEIMESFWPQAAENDLLPDYMREFGRIWTAAPKVLVSNSRTGASHNTRIIGGDDVIEQLATLRATTDGRIGVGGATLATALLSNGLLDELLLYTHPVVLGSGRPLFDDLPRPLDLNLIEQVSFPNGVVLHRYAITTPVSAAPLPT